MSANESEIRSLASKVCQALQANGATRFELHYTGSNDSTDGFESTIEPAELASAFADVLVTYRTSNSSWQNGKMVQGDRDHTDNFEGAVYQLAELLWNHAGQGGWYNNEGGYGDISIFPGGFIEFRHVNYLNDSMEYDEEGNEVGEVEQEEEEICHWRFNILVGPITAPYEDTAPDSVPA